MGPQPTGPENPAVPAPPSVAGQGAKKTLGSRLRTCTRELLGMGIWSYGVIKLWVFDLDIFLVNRLAPGLMWIIHYKFLLIVAAVAAAALMTKKATVIGWLLYIIFYPLIVLGRVIYLVFKQKSWSLALACINSVVSFFRSLKYNLLVGAGFVRAGAAALYSVTSHIGGHCSWTSAPFVDGFRAGVLSRVRPSSIFQVYQRLTRKIPGFVTKSLSGKANRSRCSQL